ncbi:MAG: NYN domain-containing protein [Christensenellaceae bacterium]
MEDKRFALLIDSDNISAKYISSILGEMTKYGVVTYRRIYGDWTSRYTTKWKSVLAENSITPIQQFSNTIGKNATDSALIIDAMDILYAKNVDGFCIVSSDSDFTRLASRLRESGMSVIGMGEKKTPVSFKSACSVFTNLEILGDQDEEPTETLQTKETPADTAVKKVIKKETSNIIDKATIENDILNIITENQNNDKSTGLGEIGSRLVKKYPDFDVRNYGYSLLSKFLEEIASINLEKQNKSVTVTLADNQQTNTEINDFIKSEVQKSGESGMILSELSNRCHAKYKTFKVKDFGYSSFSKFVQAIVGLKLSSDRKSVGMASSK